MAVARIDVPKTARRGDVIDIRTLISHTMETGYRRDYLGKTLPRDIITGFYLHVQRRGSLPRGLSSRYIRESVPRVFGGRGRQRHAAVHVDRRQRFYVHRISYHYRRLTVDARRARRG
jgi:hypothetical protein